MTRQDGRVIRRRLVLAPLLLLAALGGCGDDGEPAGVAGMRLMDGGRVEVVGLGAGLVRRVDRVGFASPCELGRKVVSARRRRCLVLVCHVILPISFASCRARGT